MPELVEQMYCSQQIVIPPKYPYVLKRYCKAAIKTQPYDLLRWSYEYFKALANHKPPPVKLRMEYPVYSTEGGLTRGCLKVLANQLSSMKLIPLPVAKAAWRGFCLDQHELIRIFCLCEVYLREETVPFLHFIGVAGGLLTKSLTNTMILLCESLTKEPDGGSAAIPLQDFLTMYRFLAKIDASKDVRYKNGYREGNTPQPESEAEEESESTVVEEKEDVDSEDFWDGVEDLQKLTLINSHVARGARLSVKLNMPTLGSIERSPSIERAKQIEWENYQRERKGRPAQSDDVDKTLREMSTARMSQQAMKDDTQKAKEEKVEEKKSDGLDIYVYDEDDNEIPYEFYGEPKVKEEFGEEEVREDNPDVTDTESENKLPKISESMKAAKEREIIDELIADLFNAREERLVDLENTFVEIAAIVDRFKSASYDLGMVAGRQMSTTSGEFIVQHIEREIMDYINEQIAILPDPDLKKKKAKPEEVAMIRDILETFLDENMDIIVPEIEEVEEEELPIPEITNVYAVPGIGPAVDDETFKQFIEYAIEAGNVQGDIFMPRNIRHFLCPPLEKYDEYMYEPKKTEEAVTSGLMTD